MKRVRRMAGMIPGFKDRYQKGDFLMKRLFLMCVGVMICAVSLGASTVLAQKFPDRTIQVTVANVPGSIMDLNARSVTDDLGKVLGTQIVVVNKGGAGTALGTAEVARAKKDGYTVGYLSAAGMVYQKISNPESVPYDPEKDLDPLGLHVFVPLTIAVQESSPWKTFQELVDYAKKNPGKLRVATNGVGGADHFNTEIVQAIAGVEFTHVPFKGGESVITAVLGGHVDLCFDAYGKIKPHVDAGKLRFLITSKKIPESPSIPTATDLGYKQGLISTWFGFYAPAGLPDDVRTTLITALKKVLEIPENKAKAEKMGFVADYKSPAESGRLRKEEAVIATEIGKKIGMVK
jgi:tripartite-type tricarboxylate transporter receptor subunit TctC